MNLRIRRYVVGDAALIRPRPCMGGEVNAIGLEILDCARPSGEAYTLTRDGMPVACGGLWPIWPGRECAWLWASDLAPREWVELGVFLFQEIGRRLKAAEHPLRIEATAGWPKARAYLERLGFACEGVMKAYGPGGQDYALYARTNRSEKTPA